MKERSCGPGRRLNGPLEEGVAGAADARAAGEPAAGDGAADGAPDAARFEGMLPVRLLRAPAAAAASSSAEASRRSRDGGQQAGDGGRRPRGGGRQSRGGARQPSGGGRHAADARRQAGSERDAAREWWELNEEGTILKGEHTGATLRLGDAIDVRVARVDSIRGRVDLTPAP